MRLAIVLLAAALAGCTAMTQVSGGERTVLKSWLSSRREVAELLQTLFVLELVHPSRCFWIVSPWVRPA